jgi:hypothetical protein
MALISEWMEQCGKKVLDNAGIVRDAMLRQSARPGGGESHFLLVLPVPLLTPSTDDGWDDRRTSRS